MPHLLLPSSSRSVLTVEPWVKLLHVIGRLWPVSPTQFHNATVILEIPLKEVLRIKWQEKGDPDSWTGGKWKESRKVSGKSHSCSVHVCVWHTAPTLHPAWAAGQVACERGAAETPFCFSGFPLFFLVGHIKTVYGLSVVTQCFNFLLVTLSPPLLLSCALPSPSSLCRHIKEPPN